ncbi:tetratricopeptide repeat protein [Bacillus massiliglaciei]|uniref:tetratricopeptide repeat protein n=1 Tax=Bacillus massiliglaciei TaxID=1816693 RepID=UPI000DA6190E|nr:tetratricopeptide repeat protein [Bacillus massiliglaciei]
MNDKNGETNGGRAKIIPFPNLSQRLLAKGMEELEARRFKQASELLSQAVELEPLDEEANMGLLVSSVEQGRYEEAKELCIDLLHKGIGDYFKISDIYLMVLLQLGDHEKIVEMVEALFSDQYIPAEKEEHYEKMLQFSRRVIEERQEEAEKEEELNLERLSGSPLFEGKSDIELHAVIRQLAGINVRPFAEEIAAFLREEEHHPFFKTMILQVLQDQEFDKKIELAKPWGQMEIIPQDLSALSEDPFLKEMEKRTERVLGSSNPTLLAMIHEVLKRQHFVLFPFDVSGGKYGEWAAAYHALAEEYMGGDADLERLGATYSAEPHEIAEVLEAVKQIEAVSYPII